MAVINSPSNRTVRGLRDTMRIVGTSQPLVDAKQANQSLRETSVVQIAEIGAGAFQDNSYDVKFQEFDFELSTVPTRQEPTLRDSSRPNGKAIALSGQSYEPGDKVLLARRFYKWFILRRLDGDFWVGTTNGVIPQGGRGNVDIITYSGTITRKVDDFFGEEVGSGVLCGGFYAPDGKNYLLLAACEADPPYSEGGTGVTPTTPIYVVTS